MLDGQREGLFETGQDWTEGMVAGAYRMLEIVKSERCPRLAVLTDMQLHAARK